MSINAMNWAGLCRVAAAGGAARAVLDAVAWFAADAGDPNATRAWPPVEIPQGQAACWRGAAELAERAEINPTTAKKAITDLVAAGVLTRQRRYRRGGSVVRRTADALLLDLTLDPVVLTRDPDKAARRAAAGSRGGRAAAAARTVRWPGATCVAERQVAAGNLGSSASDPGRQVAPSSTSGGPGLPDGRGRQVAAGHPVVRHQPPYDRRQDTTGRDSKPGTALGLGTSPVDRPAAEPVASEPERHRIALTALGSREDRKLPDGRAWSPLRRGHLGDAAFDGMVVRILDELVAAERVDPGWWQGTREQHRDVWRQVRAEMLRQQAADSPAPSSAEEVA